MKIALKLSELEREILDILYYLTYKEEKITSITEKHLRSELEKNYGLYKTLNRLIKKSFVMRTFNNRKFYYTLSPNGKRIINLFKMIDDLDLEWTKSERITRYLLLGYTLNEANYEIKRR